MIPTFPRWLEWLVSACSVIGLICMAVGAVAVARYVFRAVFP